MSPPESDPRLVDYLEDRIQNTADLDAVNGLLNSLKSQQEILKKQLLEARQDHQEARQTAEEHVAKINAQTTAFQKQQQAIDRTLTIVTRSQTSDEAVVKFSTFLSTIDRYHIAAGYLDVLMSVDAAANKCLASADNDVSLALAHLKDMQNLSQLLLPLQEAADGAAPHLTDYVKNRQHVSHEAIRSKLTKDLKTLLKKISWPSPAARIPVDLQSTWAELGLRMLELQEAELFRTESENRSRSSKEEPEVLLLYEVLVEPLAQRFHYHFSDDRTTNRLDKPDYFLRHVLDVINDYAGFAQNEVQPLLVKRFSKTTLSYIPAYMDAISALITALLPMLQRKLAAVLTEVSTQSSLLSSLVREVMWFDEKLAEWDYTPLSPVTPYRGLSHYILSTLGYFTVWLSVEQKFALARYESIISDRESGQLEYESVESTATKPSSMAVRVKDLLETVTECYRPLASFNQKMNFLIDIQLAILDRYHARLFEGLEAYIKLTSTVGRTMQGVTQADVQQTSGVNGLDRVARVLGSAAYLEQAMRDWSEDVFFLGLWEELQCRSNHADTIEGELSMSEVAAKTSSAVLAARNSSNVDSYEQLEELQGALFDETATSYRLLRIKAEDTLTETIVYDVRTALRPYKGVQQWRSLSVSNQEPSLTAELDGTVRLLDEYLGFLAKALSRAMLRRVVRPVCHALQTFLVDSIILSRSFSAAGSAQLAIDVKGLWRVIDQHAGNGQSRKYMQRLGDALLVLSLAIKDTTEDTQQLGLWEVERRLFADNDSAKAVLEALDVESLSTNECRAILKRRVELTQL